MKEGIKAIIIRLLAEDKQTLGIFQLYQGAEKIFECKTLELPYKDNKRNISSIKSGQYFAIPRTSDKYQNHYHIKELNGEEVRGRSHILIHSGNYKGQTEGCVLIGQDHIDIDGDGYKDVTSSRKTLRLLREAAPDGFKLHIVGGMV